MENVFAIIIITIKRGTKIHLFTYFNVRDLFYFVISILNNIK